MVKLFIFDIRTLPLLSSRGRTLWRSSGVPKIAGEVNFFTGAFVDETS